MNFRQYIKYRNPLVIVFVFCAAAVFTFLGIKNLTRSSAASTAGFNPGNIISDATMSNYNSMSKDDIQRFLSSKNPCDNRNRKQFESLSASQPNLKWHWENNHFVCLSEERFGDGPNDIGSGQTAAEIIYNAAQENRINPQVLIVLLQKETGLITDKIPNSGDYRKAAGYGCPDTAACDSKYYGFKNQVNNAAWQFRHNLDHDSRYYPSGKTTFVKYHPNASCGGTNVYIENRATGALYQYTPYQPNSQALGAGYGTGNNCSSYGNRNFYLYFNDWFGSTQISIDGSVITVPDGVYAIQSKVGSGKRVLDTAGGHKDNGTNIQIWDNYGNDNQKWQFTRTSSGYYNIMNLDSKKYLDLNGAVAESGRNIHLWEKSGSCAQEWRLIQTRDGYITFESACMSGMVADVAEGKDANGANVGLWLAHNGDSQKFSLIFGRTLNDGLYTINTNLSSSKVLDVSGGFNTNGTNIALWDKHGEGSQRWYISYNANGDYYTLRNPITGKYLDVNRAEAKPGTNVQLWAGSGSCAQRWKFYKNSDGSYSMLSTCSLGYAADVEDGKTTNGANVLVWPYSGSNNQKWQFTAVPQLVRNNTYVINPKLTHIKAMDITGGFTGNGTNVEIWTKHGDIAAQQWKVVYHPDTDVYTLQNPQSGKYLDLSGAIATNGRNIHMWSSSGSCAQSWLIKKTTDGYYQLASGCNENYVIDISHGVTNDGTNILLWPNNGTDNQKWKFETVKK